MHQFRIAALVALLLSLSSPVLALEELTPEPAWLYRVTAVAADDVLNIRAQPDPSAEIIGVLQPDASDIAVAGTRMEVNGSVWWQVVGSDGLGWVNARYLTPVDDMPFPNDETFALQCSGTEPFWSASVAEGEARFMTPESESETWRAGPMTRAMGLIGRYAIRLEKGEDVGHLAAWRNHRFCSDGMSDIGFPFEAVLITPAGAVHAGCCLRAGE